MSRDVGPGKLGMFAFSVSQLFLTLRGWGIYSGWAIPVSGGCMDIIESIFLGSCYAFFSYLYPRCYDLSKE